MLIFLKIVTLGICMWLAGWMGYSIIPSLTVEQASVILGLVAAAFFLGLFFGMDDD